VSEDIDGVGEIGPTGGELARRSTSARTFDPPSAEQSARSSGSRFPVPGSRLVMPAEWERHDATWIAWPHHEPDWPGKLAPIPWVYAEIVRALHHHERVEILCQDEEIQDSAQQMLDAHGVRENFRLHIVPTDRVWLRDSGPTGVIADDGSVTLVNWRFNAWAKYPNFGHDILVGSAIERITGSQQKAARAGHARRLKVIATSGRVDEIAAHVVFSASVKAISGERLHEVPKRLGVFIGPHHDAIRIEIGRY